jgi:hypothetical protein
MTDLFAHGADTTAPRDMARQLAQAVIGRLPAGRGLLAQAR